MTKIPLVRLFLCLLIGGVCSLVLNAYADENSFDDILVETTQGRLVGEVSSATRLSESPGSLAQTDGVLDKEFKTAAFKGIPYAVPPVGRRRWAAPEPAQDWAGTKIAKTYAPACMQLLSPIDDSLGQNGENIPQSEDCLYLNVFAPQDAVGDSSRKLPVLFVIHGGGMVMGASSTLAATYSLGMVEKDVVIVTVNYRLGVFGFFSHPELSEESPFGVSGNYAIQDLILALEWVKGNIAAFGGDPENVTISGPSGGGSATGLLLASPLAEGLFQRAAPMCSDAGVLEMRLLSEGYINQPSAEELGVSFAKKLGASSIEELREIPAREIQEEMLADEMQGTGVSRWRDAMSLVIDGRVLQTGILEAHASGQRADVPVLLGFNRDEASVFRGFGMIGTIPADTDLYEAEVRRRYGDLAETYLSLYPSDRFEQSAYDAVRDGGFGWGNQTVAMLSDRVSSNAYLYYMAHRLPGGDASVPGSHGYPLGVSHCTGAGFFTNQVPGIQGVEAEDLRLNSLMTSYFLAFMKTGDPNQTGLPVWKPYTRIEKGYLEFKDGAAYPSKDLLPGHWEFWDEVRARKIKNNIFPDAFSSGLNGYISPDFERKAAQDE